MARRSAVPHELGPLLPLCGSTAGVDGTTLCTGLTHLVVYEGPNVALLNAVRFYSLLALRIKACLALLIWGKVGVEAAVYLRSSAASDRDGAGSR